MSTYTVYTHSKYGKYIDIKDFKTSTNSYDEAIQEALTAAHKTRSALYLHGTINIQHAIEINQTNKNVTGIFGDGRDTTKIFFTHQQTGVHNYISNNTPPEKAGIWIDNQGGKFIRDLAIEYKHTQESDFYREGQSYFGKVNGIVVNNADHTLISNVEVSGANRAGVLFTSTNAISSGAHADLVNGKISANQLPTGDYNRVVDSYLHDNRVAGVMIAYQKMFVADNNILAKNGHPDDGGTGYGFATQAGSYNYAVTITNNTTDHNYRKGIDSHDANILVIKDNTLDGDRMFGIAIENRQFSMDKVTIQHNKIIQDPDFYISKDDDYGIVTDNSMYSGYRGIRLENKAQIWQTFHNPQPGRFFISDNTIENLTDNIGLTRAIEVRNHEKDVSYLLSINDNTITGSSADNLISVFNNPDDPDTPYKEKGPGSGNIRILKNIMKIDDIHDAPVYIEEQNTDKQLHGQILFQQNELTVKNSNGSTEGLSILSNAATILAARNTFDLGGTIDRPVIRVEGDANSESIFHFVDNTLRTDSPYTFENGDWLIRHNAHGNIHGNTHNSALGIVGNSGTTVADIIAAHRAQVTNKPSASAVFDSQADNNSLIDDNAHKDQNSHQESPVSQSNLHDIGNTTIHTGIGSAEKVIVHSKGLSMLNHSETLEDQATGVISHSNQLSDLLDSHSNSLNLNTLTPDAGSHESTMAQVTEHYYAPMELPHHPYTGEESIDAII